MWRREAKSHAVTRLDHSPALTYYSRLKATAGDPIARPSSDSRRAVLLNAKRKQGLEKHVSQPSSVSSVQD